MFWNMSRNALNILPAFLITTGKKIDMYPFLWSWQNCFQTILQRLLRWDVKKTSLFVLKLISRWKITWDFITLTMALTTLEVAGIGWGKITTLDVARRRTIGIQHAGDRLENCVLFWRISNTLYSTLFLLQFCTNKLKLFIHNQCNEWINPQHFSSKWQSYKIYI